LKLFLINILSIFFIALACISAQTLVVSKSAGNEIKFSAEATFNNFQGITKAVDGFIILNKNSLNNSELDLKVPLDSIDTGIGLRNKHMRGYLNTDNHPYAEFKGTIINKDSVSLSEFNLKANGNFSVNGATKKLTIDGKFYDFGKLKKINTHFEIKLSDYNIEQPSFLFNKVHDDIKLDIIIYFTKQE
jgi:polyisoprenoid-binding protein YceI